MRIKDKIYLVILGLAALFLSFGLLPANSLQANELGYRSEIVSPASLPHKGQLVLVTVFSVAVDEELVGVSAVYDDPTTARPVDYMELYDTEGDLVAVGWFDQFGIERTAVDRGLLEPDQDELEGVFVLIVEGDLV